MPDMYKRACAIQQYCSACRRYLHAHPELSAQEYQTTAYIRRELEHIGVTILPLPLETGLVAMIGGLCPGPVTALRADIDALPAEDLSRVPYASQNPGVSHACGHDGHTAILLGVAKLLKEMEEELRGTVKLIFQPAEEALCGEDMPVGANSVINAGAMENPAVEEIVSLHGWPAVPTGKIAVQAGYAMAAADKIHIKIHGRSGHGAMPHNAVNPIVAAAHVITALQNIVSGEIDAAERAVVSICTVHAGNAFNLIPDTAELKGTVRCLNPHIREELERRIRRAVSGAAAALGCLADTDYIRCVPALRNHPEVTGRIMEAARQTLGDAAAEAAAEPSMASEDFSRFVNHANGSGALFRLGVGRPSGTPALHNSAFDFDDGALPGGVAVMAQYIWNRHH